MSEKQNLYLLTDYYPYGEGEPFVAVEAAQLSRFFTVTVVPRYVSSGPIRPMPAGVMLLSVPRSKSLWVSLRSVLSFCVKRQGRKEIAAVLKSGKKHMARLGKSLSAWVSAELTWYTLKKSGAVAHPKDSVYYSFWYTPAALALSFHRPELDGANIIVRTNGYDLYNERAAGGRQPFKPAADAGMDMIVFSCQYGKEYYKKTFGETEGVRYVYSPLGCEAPGKAVTSGEDVFQLLSCSNTSPVKRINRIIDALAELDGLPVRWTHLGGGAELEELKAYAGTVLDGKPLIQWRFLGSLSHEDVLAYYTKEPVDCFITTSASEGGCPVSIQETMACGVPVIGTAVGGITEMLSDSGNILLSPNPTAEEVALAIQWMSTLSEAERDALHQENRQRWADRYQAEINAQQLAQWINKQRK